MGRSAVPADVAAIRPQPVVVRRELIVEQLVGEASAAPILAVAPQTLLVEAPAAAELRVSWTGTGAGSYKLWHRTVASYDAAAADAKWTGVVAVDVTGTGPRFSHTLTGLTGGTEYYVAVSAVVGTTESPRSPLVAARALYAAPAAPANPKTTLSTVVEGQITFSWDAVASTTFYVPQIRLPGATEFVTTGIVLPSMMSADGRTGTTGTSATYNGAVVGSTYGFRVLAYRQYAVVGDFSAVVEATPVALAPAKPAKPVLSTTSGVNGGLTVTFTMADRADAHDGGYRIVGAASWTEVENVTSPWQFVGTVGSQYEARVKGTRTGTADGEWSDASNRITAAAVQRSAARDATKDISQATLRAAFGNPAYVDLSSRAGGRGGKLAADGMHLWVFAQLGDRLEAFTLPSLVHDSSKSLVRPVRFTQDRFQNPIYWVGMTVDATTLYIYQDYYGIAGYNKTTKARDTSKDITISQLGGSSCSYTYLAADATTMWVVCYRFPNNRIIAVNKATKTVDSAKSISLTTLVNAGVGVVDGLAVDDQALWVLDSSNLQVVPFNKTNGAAVLTRVVPRTVLIQGPNRASISPRGLAIDGNTMWMADAFSSANGVILGFVKPS